MKVVVMIDKKKYFMKSVHPAKVDGECKAKEKEATSSMPWKHPL